MLSNDVFVPEKFIELNGRAIGNECPIAAIDEAERTLRVRPLDVVNLDGGLSSDPDGPNGQPSEVSVDGNFTTRWLDLTAR